MKPASPQSQVAGSRFRILFPVLLIVLTAATSPARAVDSDALRRKQDAQERARDMARQLVTGILDVQLQQLEENGLKDLPLYRDIASMKKNIGALVDKEMEQAVEMLVKAQRGTETERDAAFRQARQMIRQIVTRLAAERQNLLRRLKSAELTAQVQRLVNMETKVWQATKTLPEQLPSKQETIALAAIEDQGDVKQLFLQLIDTLVDVSQWEGPLGAGAADGLRILQAASVGTELDQAGRLLNELRYPDAAKSQQLVIKGLRLLLEKLAETQGLVAGDNQSTLALARELIEKQEKLRDQTKQADLTQPEAERLVEQQAAIRKELNQLAQAIGTMPAAETLLEQAKSAAYEATGRLFDAKAEEAVAEQGKVLANLASVAEQLAQNSVAEHSDKSAAELARQVRDLEQARADVARLRAEQAQVDRTAMQDAPQAGRQEQQVAQGLAKVDDNRDLPKAVVSRLASAEQALAAAAKALALQNAAKPADEMQKQSVQNADRALERAAAEIAAALDDAKRRAAGVEIGELARAAETLERAAAAERDISRAAQTAAGDKGLAADAAKQLAERQGEIEKIAQRVGQAVEQSAGEASKTAQAAAQAAAASRRQLEQAAGKPGADSKPAAQEAAKSSATAADKLSQAAAELRKQIGKSAESLVAESSQQLSKVSPVREAVDQAVAKSDSAAGDKMERLALAERAVRNAMASQERAAGRPAAADAMQLAEGTREALTEQARAEVAAQQFAQGQLSSPLEAISREQGVAEKSSKLAEAAAKRPQAQAAKTEGKPDPLTDSLNEAARAAAKAARAELDGNQSQARAARDQARASLEQAAQAAAGEAEQSSKAPAGKPDAAAQKQVGKEIAEASKLADPDAPPAAQSLADAGKSSGEAQQQAESGNSDKARGAQQQTGKSLKSAAEQLKAAREQLAGEQSRQLAQQAKQADELANQSAGVDPAALAALRDAQSRAARAGKDQPAEKSSRGSEAQSQARRDFERAAANLSGREQRIERDKAIAEAVRDMARDQQQASDDIARRSKDLLAEPQEGDSTDEPAAGSNSGKEPGEGASEKGNRPGKSGKPSRSRQAAEALAQAQRRFSQNQRATGEAAEEVAAQSQIANRPLREAMDLASKLPVQAPPDSPAASSGSLPPGDLANAQAVPADENSGLGTGFIPNSPEATARMIAGEEAAARAAALLGNEFAARLEGLGSGQDAEPGDQPGDSEAGQAKSARQGQSRGKHQAKSSSSGSSAGTSKDGETPNNPELKQGPLEVAANAAKSGDSKSGSAARDADSQARNSPGQEAWFARLPPDLRKAIRAKAQRPPPRSYEDKLQRYFQSLD